MFNLHRLKTFPSEFFFCGASAEKYLTRDFFTGRLPRKFSHVRKIWGLAAGGGVLWGIAN